MSRDSRTHAYAAVPIPTYEEAIGGSSSSHLGPTQTSHDAQRQGLLGGSSTHSHRQPTVESARNSMDSDLSIPEMVPDEQHERRNIEELDYLEPGESEAVDRRQARRYHRARLRSKLAQSFSNLSATLSSIRLPSIRRLYSRVPESTAETTEPPSSSWRSRLLQSLYIPTDYRMSIPMFARLFALMMIAAFVWFLFSSNLFTRRRGMMATMFEPESVRAYVQANIDGNNIRRSLQHLALFAHEAGSEGDAYMAKWISETWKASSQFDEEAMVTYYVLANYPYEEGRSLKVLEPAKLEATLEEPQQNGLEITLPWHVHSANGVVTGPLLYAGDGSRESFEKMSDAGITTNGTIALVYSSSSNDHNAALTIRFAHEAGCAGVLVFNGESLPDETPLPKSIHRANVALSNWLLGDPYTPGRPSQKGAEKDRDAGLLALPAVPSLPLSWSDGKTLLDLLGLRNYSIVTDRPDKTYVAELQNENDIAENQPIWQVVASIAGAEASNQRIVIGAPRDSWCFGMAHSASATAILTELVRIFGDLRHQGWLPLRTLEFVSWSGSTFNAAGSTEYVEGHVDPLHDEGVAYINVASGMSGKDFIAAGSPLLQKILMRAIKRVIIPDLDISAADGFDPNVDHFLGEAYESVVEPLKRPEKVTDAAPFTYIVGMPSLDLGFSGKEGHLVEGTCYDDLNWAQHAQLNVSGDHETYYHEALAQVWALVVLELASAPLVPLDVRTYSEHINAELDQFEKDVVDLLRSEQVTDTINVEPLRHAAGFLSESADTFHAYEEEWMSAVLANGDLESLYHNRLRMSWNARLIMFEKALIDKQQHKDDGSPGGLKGRSQFRHILTAPKKWSHGTLFLPSVWDYLDDKQWQKAQGEIERVAAMLREAALPLSSG